MKKLVRAASFAFALLLLVAGSGAAWYTLSAPPVENLALAPELIAVSSAEGQRLLGASDSKTDFDQLAPHIVGQARRAFCGPASSVAVVNAARRPQPPVTQSSVFDVPAATIKSELAVSVNGMTLEQLAALLRAQGLQVQPVHANESDANAFRELVRAATSEPNKFVIVNYDRRALHQAGAGHISPIGAYEATTDRVLVLDVATQKYPFTWIPLPMLWAAVNTTDSDSGQARGYLVVSSR